jgi:hypothetical protein
MRYTGLYGQKKRFASSESLESVIVPTIFNILLTEVTRNNTTNSSIPELQ